MSKDRKEYIQDCYLNEKKTYSVPENTFYIANIEMKWRFGIRCLWCIKFQLPTFSNLGEHFSPHQDPNYKWWYFFS